ncbi:hypothetical protein [Klebsiella pneumoniae IS43]|uniref:Uncharacterized protein n=1 Tax=Klebsiella pneumoniae IS43 TaxID=1432552 RepID=W1DIC7_KLEPN|nr:hypothetical protein [Klebsiella pneumoniae IS43]
MLAIAGDQVQRLRLQQLGRCPARLRQLKEDIDIEARLVAGVPAVKAPARRHPHVANQHGSHTFIVHLITQALNKLNQIRMTEVATLIGTHHLIAGGTQGERLGANDTAIGKTRRLTGRCRRSVGLFSAMAWRPGYRR